MERRLTGRLAQTVNAAVEHGWKHSVHINDDKATVSIVNPLAGPHADGAADAVTDINARFAADNGSWRFGSATVHCRALRPRTERSHTALMATLTGTKSPSAVALVANEADDRERRIQAARAFYAMQDDTPLRAALRERLLSIIRSAEEERLAMIADAGTVSTVRHFAQTLGGLMSGYLHDLAKETLDKEGTVIKENGEYAAKPLEDVVVIKADAAIGRLLRHGQDSSTRMSDLVQQDAERKALSSFVIRFHPLYGSHETVKLYADSGMNFIRYLGR